MHFNKFFVCMHFRKFFAILILKSYYPWTVIWPYLSTEKFGFYYKTCRNLMIVQDNSTLVVVSICIQTVELYFNITVFLWIFKLTLYLWIISPTKSTEKPGVATSECEENSSSLKEMKIIFLLLEIENRNFNGLKYLVES
jgi:hypothetical protein